MSENKFGDPETWEPIANRVLIKLGTANDRYELKSGLILYMDTDFEKGKHATVRGTVVSTPKKLTFSKTECLLDYKVDMELLPGDDIIYKYSEYLNNQKDGNIFPIDGNQYMFVEYDEIILGIRDEEVVMVNGFILVEPDELEKSSKIIITLEEGDSEKTGVIRYMGAPIKWYHDFKESDPKGLNVGDRVLFRKVDSLPLEYSDHKTFDKKKTYYRMQRRDVVWRYD